MNRARGRPRRFDLDEAVAAVLPLFHARGYDALGVADITAALGISPPSFYAAFGSKAGFFARVLARWTDAGGEPLTALLVPDRPVADSLAAMLAEAARRYAADPAAGGCLVLEGMRCGDREAREAACALHREAEEAIHAHIAARHPQDARRLTDFVVTTLAGLSAKARSGHRLDQLLATARLAAVAITRTIQG